MIKWIKYKSSSSMISINAHSEIMLKVGSTTIQAKKKIASPIVGVYRIASILVGFKKLLSTLSSVIFSLKAHLWGIHNILFHSMPVGCLSELVFSAVLCFCSICYH